MTSETDVGVIDVRLGAGRDTLLGVWLVGEIRGNAGETILRVAVRAGFAPCCAWQTPVVILGGVKVGVVALGANQETRVFEIEISRVTGLAIIGADCLAGGAPLIAHLTATAV